MILNFFNEGQTVDKGQKMQSNLDTYGRIIHVYIFPVKYLACIFFIDIIDKGKDEQSPVKTYGRRSDIYIYIYIFAVTYFTYILFR